MIKENELFLFLATHIEVEGQYLKIWAQTDEMVIQSVTKMLLTLQNELECCQNNIISPNNVMRNTHCCARGPNNAFSRAKILDFRSDGMVLVQFVDYGNIVHVPIHNIRLVDNVPGAEYLFSVPAAATCFILADVMPIGGSWLPEVVKQIRSFLVNNKFQGVYRESNGCKIIKFNMFNEDFGSLLVNRNMALFSSSCVSSAQPMATVPVQNLRIPHQARSTQENWRMPAVPQPVPQPIPQPIPQKVVKTNSFKAIQLAIGSVHDVQVSYVDEGPCKFSVQLLENIACLEDMMKAINSRPHISLQESPIAGTVCLGQQTHPQRLCRVVLNSPGDTSCKVYYADYGHHEVLPFSSLYQIPDEFVLPDIFSIRFTLNGISGWNASQEMKDYFGGLVANKHLKLRVCKGPLSPLTQYCDLYLNGKSVRDILSEVFPESCELFYPEPKQLQIGVNETVTVAFVESTARFFVQIESDAKFLDDIMQQVEKASMTAARLTHGQIRRDMPCIALYDDQKWYRGLILNIIDDTKVSIFYVDYGNQEIVLMNNLRPIPPHLVTSLPKQAIQCSLNGYQFESGNSELIKIFEDLVFEERMILVAFDCVNGSYIVNLHDAKYISDPMADIGNKIRAMHKQANVRNQESLEKYPVQHQRSEEKSQLVQKPRVKNKNVKARENWTGAGNWNKDKEPGMIQKTNSYETYDNSKSKFRKDNENEQRHDNRFRRENPDYQSGSSANRFAKDERKSDRFDQNDRYGKYTDNTRFVGAKDYPSGDRFNRSTERSNFEMNRTGKEIQNNRSNINSRLDRNYGSDKDSDTSSKSGGKRNNRHGKQTEDQRARVSPSNRNRTGRWENDRHNNNDASRNGFSNYNNVDVIKAKSPKDSRTTRPDKTESPEYKYTPQIPSQIPPPNITVGAVKNCIMVFYNNPTSFYVQLCPDNCQLNIIMDKIYSIYEKGGNIIPLSHIKEGLYCIAQWQEDKQWYRAVVKNVDHSVVTVHFIDYGNLERISSDKIKEIQSELTKLPTQAIHCKLFCPPKSNWTKEESDQLVTGTDGKQLEAEFVAVEQGVYSILLKDLQSNKYLNNVFANDVDLLKEKEIVRNKVKSSARGDAIAPVEYASLNEKWLEYKVDFGKTYNASLTYFLNPENFYLQLQMKHKEFRDMMNEIQMTYARRQPVTEPLEVGSSVIAILPEDGVLYRANIAELDKPRGPIVQYVDYGDRAMVDSRKIYPVEKKYMILPKQAVFCSLKNVAPISGSNWSNATEIGKFFNAEKFECIFHELQNDKYFISLNVNGVDIGNALVQSGLAVFSSIEKVEELEDVTGEIVQTEEVPRIDVNLLEGQTLHVQVSNVEGVNKFYVQFYTANACQQTVNSYMASKDPQVMPGLLSHEVCLGAGCLINSKGKWRRGVVVNFTKSYYDVRLIDTGEHEKVTLKSMLKLPGQLSVMQNQAVECSLFDVPLSSKADDMLKSLINKKDAKIFVEKVERNRLVVRLFDMNGNKIKVVGTQNTERISPICNMPILSSTHDVIVTNVKNSTCIWLQRVSDALIEKQLLDDMYDYYSKVKVQAMAIENELFAGRWVDNNWYRVIILELKGSDEVKVQLIDYGDTGYILATELRTLDSKFHVPHQLAISVSLTVTLSSSDESQIDLLESMVKDKQLSATLYNVNRKWVAELSDNGEKLSDKLKALNVVKETTITPFEYAEVSEMVIGERYEVTVSHIDTPNLLWLQRKEQAEALYDLHDQMQQVASSCSNYEDIPEEKSLCLAVYSLDGFWYRAEVIDADADITTVRFIDYGNTDVINSGAGCIKQLPDKWKAVKKYAIPCKLDVVPANSDDWTEEACARIKNLTSVDNALTALIITDKAPMRIDLFLDDKSMCELLIAERHAAHVKSSDELEEELEVGEEEQFDPRSAFVSHIVSVDEFWVQEDAKVKDLEMVADRLVIATVCPPLQQVEPGIICIAHYPEDNQYYRAIIVSNDDRGIKVNYIDYGNSAITDDIRVIPSDLAIIPPLSKKCCLAKPDGVKDWPDNVNVEFDKLAANGATVFILDVIAEGETFLVRMMRNSKDVAIELLELCAKSKVPCVEDEGIVVHDSKDITTKERPTPIGEENITNMCRISYVDSPTEFWIQRKADYAEIGNILKRISDSESLAPVENVDVGKILAVRSSDDDPRCYRCRVSAKFNDGLQVILIDLGSFITVHSNTLLRELPDDLTHIPALAVCCTLKLPEGLEQWPACAYRKFNYLTTDDLAEFRYEILDESERPLPIALFYKDENVAELLLSDSDENFLKDKSSLNTESPDREVMYYPNIAIDSTIHTEIEQNLSEDTKVQIEIVANDLNDKCETAISLVVEANVTDDDFYENSMPHCEDEHQIVSYQEEVFVDVAESIAVEEEMNNPKPNSLIDEQDKIVPGSISRGLSNEEISRYSPVHSHSCPEEKIVPGSINKGHTFKIESVSSLKDGSSEAAVTTINEENYESKHLLQLAVELQAISFDDTVVPSCISRGETLVSMDRPTTPKTVHSDKLVAGAVNAQSTLNNEDEEETLSVEVDKHIPEATA